MPAKLLFLTCVVSFAVLANPQIKNGSPKAPPEVKKTVNALAGRWHFEGTDSEPRAAAPQRVVMEIECRQAALGTAVACTLTGRMAGFGPLEAAAIVGYNQDEHLVHWMEISSTGEYHDHRGKWKGDRIELGISDRSGMAEKHEEKRRDISLSAWSDVIRLRVVGRFCKGRIALATFAGEAERNKLGSNPIYSILQTLACVRICRCYLSGIAMPAGVPIFPARCARIRPNLIPPRHSADNEHAKASAAKASFKRACGSLNGCSQELILGLVL